MKFEVKVSIKILVCFAFPLMIVAAITLYARHSDGAANGFTRRFKKSAKYPSIYNLETTSYYIAGLSDSSIILGDHGNSGRLKILPYDLGQVKSVLLNLPDSVHFAWGTARIYPQYKGFILAEGVTPRIFAFSASGTRLQELATTHKGFDLLLPADSCFMARSYDRVHKRNILASDIAGRILKSSDSIMTDQQDGVFSTDGMLLYDNKSQRFAYVYYYRNQITVFNMDFTIIIKGTTIDTTTHARIEISKINSEHRVTFSAPAHRVNKHAFADGGRLYIYSALRADNESGRIAYTSSVIDVYSMETAIYLFSFYIPDNDKKGIRDLAVNTKAGKIVLLRDKDLTVYPLVGP